MFNFQLTHIIVRMFAKYWQSSVIMCVIVETILLSLKGEILVQEVVLSI